METMDGEVVAAVEVERLVNEIWERHGAVLMIALSALLTFLAWYADTNGWGALKISLYVAAYVTGGYRKALKGLKTLIKEHDLDVDLLMVVAAVGAASIGYWQDRKSVV